MTNPNVIKFQVMLETNIESLKNNINKNGAYDKFEHKYKKTNKAFPIFYFFWAILIFAASFTINSMYPGYFTYIVIGSVVLTLLPSIFNLISQVRLLKTFNGTDDKALLNYYVSVIINLEKVNNSIKKVDKSLLATPKYLNILYNLGNLSTEIAEIINNTTREKMNDTQYLSGSLKQEWEKAFNFVNQFSNFLHSNGMEFLQFAQQYLICNKKTI